MVVYFIRRSKCEITIISWCNSFIKALIHGANNLILSSNSFFAHRETEIRATKIIEIRLIYVILTYIGNQCSNNMKCAFQYFKSKYRNPYWLFNYSMRPSFRLFNGKNHYWIYIYIYIYIYSSDKWPEFYIYGSMEDMIVYTI